MKYLVLLFLILVTHLAIAQEERPEAESILSIDGPVTIELEGKEEEEDYEIPKKKKKKNVFYDLKTKKRFTRTGYGNRVVTELFYVLKDFQLPETLVRDIYWFDYKRNEVRVGGNIDERNGAILHGPYTKEQNGVIIEEGIFYMGLKHGRWVKKDRNDVLVDKEKFYKGWPKQSLVVYYDRDRKQMKEIIPIEYGEKEGNYFYFHKNGKIAVRGEFKWDKKIGDWYEFYPSGQRKKLVRYGKDPYDKQYKPFILREWNPKGQVVYENRNN